MATKINNLRDKMHISTRTAAKKAGISTTTLHNLETDVDYRATYPTIIKLANFYGVNYHWLTNDGRS